MTPSAFGTFAPLIEDLLRKRSVAPEDVPSFLSPDYAAHTHDPFLLKDMDVAVARVFAAMQKGERIAIYADFDCDGIPGSVVLWDFFQKIGYTNVEVYIPHRDLEGYGLHADALDTLKAHGVTLMITVDVGTVAGDGIAYAKELGIDTIVTDHHEIGDRLPDAVAVINPKRAPYPFPDLCGAATAFKLAQACLIAGKKEGKPGFADIPEGWEKWLLDMVGIATVADMVPLRGENRVLARFGLKVLRRSQRPGIAALCRVLRVSQASLTEDDIGFSIGPRINAASRMDNPELAFLLLSTKSVPQAELTAAKLEGLNKERKGVVAAMVKDIKKRLEHRTTESSVLVLGDPTWKPSLLGLVATSVVGSRGGAVCIWGRDGNGKLKGSCRSDGSVDVVKLFEAAEEAFIEFGGHKMSGGFSVSAEAVHTLQESLDAAVDKARLDTAEKVSHDADLALHEITWDLYDALTHLSPFGLGNSKPVFRFTGVEIRTVRQFGKAKEHLELELGDGANTRAKAISFFMTADDLTAPPSPGEVRTIFATLEKSTFGRIPELRLRIIDAVQN